MPLEVFGKARVNPYKRTLRCPFYLFSCKVVLVKVVTFLEVNHIAISNYAAGLICATVMAILIPSTTIASIATIPEKPYDILTSILSSDKN